MIKVETCADCVHHACRSECVRFEDVHCLGWCLLHKHAKKCYGKSCKDYQLDEFFKSVD